MNVYGKLIKIDGSFIYYAYGTSTEDMSGILMIDTEKKEFLNLKKPETGTFLTNNFLSFANMVLNNCLNGIIKEKVSREIG